MRMTSRFLTRLPVAQCFAGFAKSVVLIAVPDINGQHEATDDRWPAKIVRVRLVIVAQFGIREVNLGSRGDLVIGDALDQKFLEAARKFRIFVVPETFGFSREELETDFIFERFPDGCFLVKVVAVAGDGLAYVVRGDDYIADAGDFGGGQLQPQGAKEQ